MIVIVGAVAAPRLVVTRPLFVTVTITVWVPAGSVEGNVKVIRSNPKLFVLERTEVGVIVVAPIAKLVSVVVSALTPVR